MTVASRSLKYRSGSLICGFENGSHSIFVIYGLMNVTPNVEFLAYHFQISCNLLGTPQEDQASANAFFLACKMNIQKMRWLMLACLLVMCFVNAYGLKRRRYGPTIMVPGSTKESVAATAWNVSDPQILVALEHFPVFPSHH
ncbi:hypothetical protein TELCIR_11382 [Teladorsagia circumcincta]|uniref:Uncharacterized protein n=1 Tax=Teladorsagia circumcincta TaxID=45464 RepID=A0A2G9U9J8_TELCI|nr:hypothetical protein TELCIR_11382 [Teladorsagia circumcincta]